MTAEELESTCGDICPHCKASVKTRQRTDTLEWVHDIFRGNAISHAFCLASHFRNKHKDSLSG